jgi:hypothetical protein
MEDQAIPLALSASLVDRDGSEAMSVVLTGFPTGARLSAGINNGDGSWTLTPAQLTGLTVTPPHDWSGRMALTMRAHAMERSTGEVATTEVGFAVVVAGAADAPLVDAPAALRGAEDQPIALDLIAALTDRDGSESLVIVVTGVPVGGSFSSGAMNPDGSWTIPGAALPGLAFTPPVNYAGTLRLDVAAMSLEADGDSAETRFSIAVTVDPVADAPVVALAAVTGDEDRALALNLAATLTDTDGSESIARYLVSGLPAGATLSAGTRDGDVWTLTPAQAVSVTMMPPPHWSGSVSLSVTAVSREAANGDEASTSTALSVTILPVADAPVLAASPVSGSEDQPIALHLAATLADTDGSESIARYLVSGLPAGASLSAGTEEAGIWTLTPAQAAGVAFIPPPNWAGSVSLSVTAVAREAASGAEASTTTTLPVTVQRVADAPILAAAAATGSEDASVALGLSAVLADTDGSESFAAITVSGLPAGFGLSAGTALGGGTWALQPAQLAGLRLTLPPDWNGSLSLTFGARAQDGASTANTSRVFDVTVAAVNDAPVLSLAQPGGAAVGQEQAAAIGEATIADVDDARMASATISLAGAVAGDRLVVTGHALQDLGDTTLIGTTGIALARTADGGVTLSGAASRATYGAVLASLALENTAGLSAGTRRIGVTLYDEAGAAAAMQLVTLPVEPSLITGDGDAAELSGTTGHDTFLGSFGDETMRGAAGADLFVVGPGGGMDLVDGGAGTDTLRISGAGAPGEGGWTLIVDGAVQPVEYSDRYDFAQPVSGHVQFADGTQVELLQIERITW